MAVRSPAKQKQKYEKYAEMVLASSVIVHSKRTHASISAVIVCSVDLQAGHRESPAPETQTDHSDMIERV